MENIIEKINRLRAERNAVVMAHYYCSADVQDVADFVGDSLALAEQATKTEADVIVLAGVHFMAETAKILNPSKTVLLPNMAAGCSLAECCTIDSFAKFVKNNPDRTVISYVNTSAQTKTMSDIICTSSNAVEIVRSLGPDARILFAPDRNLGNYIRRQLGYDDDQMIVFDGSCHIHQAFKLSEVERLKADYPQAKVLVHPEAPPEVVDAADFVGSTAALLRFSAADTADTYIVVTENGIIHQMQKLSPNKNFIPAHHQSCGFMKLSSLDKIAKALENLSPEITMSDELMAAARRPIERMMEISRQIGLIR